MELKKKSSTQMEIVWKATKLGTFNDTIILSDDIGSKKDIKLVMKSINPKHVGAAKQKKSGPLLSKRLKPSPKKDFSVHLKKNKKIVLNQSHTPCVNLAQSASSSLKQPLNQCNNTLQQNFKKYDDIDEKSNKENESLVSNSLDPFSTILLTPAPEKAATNYEKLEYLASLPTPTGNKPFSMTTKKPLNIDNARFADMVTLKPKKFVTIIDPYEPETLQPKDHANGFYKEDMINKTRTITPPTALAVLSEENESDSFSFALQSHTFNVASDNIQEDMKQFEQVRFCLL